VTRRELFALPAALTAAGQSTFPGVAYRDYARCLPDYLRSLGRRAYQARNAELAKLTTAESKTKSPWKPM